MRTVAFCLIFILAGLVGLGSVGQTQPSTVSTCFNSVPTPLASPGAAIAMQCDSNGRLITSGSSGGGASPIPTPTGGIYPVSFPTPLPVILPTILPALAPPVILVCPSTSPGVINGAYPCQINASGQLSVIANTPAPAATVSPGLVNGAAIVGPGSAVGAFNGANIATVTSGGLLNVNIGGQTGTNPLVVNTPAPAPTGTTGAVGTEEHAYTHTVQANPSSSPVPVKASAGTLGGLQFYNGAAVTNFIQVFDKLPVSVTLGTTAPDKVLACPTVSMCFLPLPMGGVAMTTGITMYCTTTVTGATGCATGTQLMVDYHYHDVPCDIDTRHLRITPRFSLTRICRGP
jgi:hypothetical protein